MRAALQEAGFSDEFLNQFRASLIYDPRGLLWHDNVACRNFTHTNAVAAVLTYRQVTARNFRKCRACLHMTIARTLRLQNGTTLQQVMAAGKHLVQEMAMVRYHLKNSGPADWRRALRVLDATLEPAQQQWDVTQAGELYQQAAETSRLAHAKLEEYFGDERVEAWANRLAHAERMRADNPDGLPIPDGVGDAFKRPDNREQLLESWSRHPNAWHFHPPAKLVVDLWERTMERHQHEWVVVAMGGFSDYRTAPLLDEWFTTLGGARALPEPVAELFVSYARQRGVDVASMSCRKSQAHSVAALADKLRGKLGVERAVAASVAAAK